MSIELAANNGTVVISPSKLCGEVRIIPSKSISHRMLIAAALSQKSTINNIAFSQDIIATLNCLEALGKNKITFENNFDPSFVFEQKPQQEFVLPCNESGTTLRLMIPVALASKNHNNQKIVLTGAQRLFARPLEPYFEIFDKQNIKYKLEKNSLTLCGTLKSGNFDVRGDVSSQFISGLIFALTHLEGNSVINITTALESKSYVDLTIDALSKFGVKVFFETPRKIVVEGNQVFQNANVSIEGDFSHAAFFLVGGAISTAKGKKVVCKNLNINSLQGDREIINILQKMGAKIEQNESDIVVYPSKLLATTIDGSQIPDIVPILAVAASQAEGTTNIINAQRLKIKESDRLFSTTKELSAIGIDIQQTHDGLIVEKSKITSGKTTSHKDHRIAMTVAIAATQSCGDVELFGASSVAKSAPDFWNEYRSIGGIFNEQ